MPSQSPNNLISSIHLALGENLVELAKATGVSEILRAFYSSGHEYKQVHYLHYCKKETAGADSQYRWYLQAYFL